VKKIVAVILLITLMLTSIAGCGKYDAALKGIRDRGVLRVGVKLDVPGLGFFNQETGEFEGLEIDLARLIALKILGDENAIEFSGVTTQTKGPMLDNGELDIVIATYTITEARKERYNFTQPYYTDSIGFLVKAGSSMEKMADMDGKTIGVMQLTTSEEAIVAEAEKLGIDVNLKRHASYPEMKAALVAGEIDAFSADKSILTGYEDSDTCILEEGFNPQHYGIATKLDNRKLSEYLDEFLSTIIKDGRYDEIIDRWS